MSQGDTGDLQVIRTDGCALSQNFRPNALASLRGDVVEGQARKVGEELLQPQPVLFPPLALPDPEPELRLYGSTEEERPHSDASQPPCDLSVALEKSDAGGWCRADSGSFERVPLSVLTEV